MIAALGRELQSEEARVLVDAAERFATVFGAIQAAAAEELVRERSRELEWLANTDALTGLYNLRYLQQHIRHLVGIQQRYGHAFARPGARHQRAQADQRRVRPRRRATAC